MAKPPACPNPCNVLLIGGGGREHALAWKLRQSPRLGELWITEPHNAGLAKLGTPCPQPMDMKNTFQMQRWCERNSIHLVVIGPEAPLAAGVADILRTPARQVFGPSRAGARLEADKAYAKQLMLRYSIATANAREFDDYVDARGYVLAREEPCVVKASGLASGKGAIVCDTTNDALEAIERIMERREFGAAGDRILIEDKLSGQEVSVLALVDGRTITVLDPCQDHKQAHEGDTGPNTGGMGAYCPTPLIDRATMAVIERDILVPTVHALATERIDYRGVLYAGIMLTPAGPKVLEFNCRFGDPECQPLMMRLRSDLVDVLWAASAGTLERVDIEFDPRIACCVVMCARGYPGEHDKGKVITGIEEAEGLGTDATPVKVFHAGTTIDHNGELVTSGGRVLGVTAMADDLHAARDVANAACEQIHFEGAWFRRDIGDRVLART